MHKRALVSAAMLLAAVPSFAQYTRTAVFTNLHRPVAIAQPPGETARMFVVEQRGQSTVLSRPLANSTGRISVWNPSTGTEIATSLLVTGLNTGSEEGLLGLAFDPNYATNGYIYVTVTVGNPKFDEIRRYTRSAGNANTFDSNSAYTILRISDPYENHNGGTLRFGRDGFLYFGVGDGGSANDPGNRSQDVNSLLGKMLRIDVNGDDFPADANRNYRIPASNPFAGAIPGEDEIWAVGLRNPWKWDFDYPRRNGMDGLFIADVGQDVMEEANHVVSTIPGVNYGWKTYEGTLTTGLSGSVAITNPKWPFFTFTHAVGYSISGGTAYRGTNLGTAAWGNYFVGDYSGWMTWIQSSFDLESGTLLNTLLALTSSTFTPKLATSGNVSIESDNNGELWTCRMANPSLGDIGRIDATAGASRSLTGTLVMGDMLFGDYAPKGVQVEIRMNSAPSTVIPLTVGLAPDGRLRIPVPTGAGRISVNHGSWLRRTVAFNTTSASVTGINVICVNGDVDGSGEIDAADIDEVIADFGIAAPAPAYSANLNSDTDRSGEVDAADIDIVISNFGAVDDVP